MKNFKILILLTLSFFYSCKPSQTKSSQKEVQVFIDLNQVKDDKVMVTIMPSATQLDEVTFALPKTVPGTYSTDNYGKLIEDVKAFDKENKELTISKIDDNSWKISTAKKLAKVTYWVNDTYDTEKGGGFGTGDIFSPAGSNISADNFVINMHAFVGYFNDKLDVPYTTTVSHSEALIGLTSLTDIDNSATKDVFKNYRYASLVEHPVMYAKPDFTTFKIDDMDILIGLYSPNGVYKVSDISESMEKMMRAQKKFLGAINNTKKYAVLIYLSDIKKEDAKGFGALEHPTCTTVVMPEAMAKDQLAEQLKDVVSHEFFHIVTPLGVHSREIHDFDYNNPKMSKHLWMYEGVTEYFANLFQINQGLISEEEFYSRMAGKIENASKMNDTMSFTEMSANVLNPPYKEQYINVYEKGALIGMCIDMIIREKSEGKRGIRDLMEKLNNEFGEKKPFNDDALFDKITALTYPEVRKFIDTHVVGTKPINYADFFVKMGVGAMKTKKPLNPILNGQEPLVRIDQTTKAIMTLPSGELPTFYKSLGMKNGDTILKVNNQSYNLDNINDLLIASLSWKENDNISVTISRQGKEKELKGKVQLDTQEADGLQFSDESKKALKDAWLKG
jgi:predicted metalloprotease with PDZ domain